MPKGILNKASLVMVPEAPIDGTMPSVFPEDRSGDFTFTRGSNLSATRVASNGLIEKGRENLLLQSNQFDTTWILGGGLTLTSAQTGYDGSSDAWLYADTATGNSLQQNKNASGVQTLSIYAKAGTADGIRLRWLGGSGGDAYFNIADASTEAYSSLNTISTKKEDIGSGWFRVSLTFNDSVNNIRVYVADGSTTSSVSGNIVMQDAQLEVGLVATDYIESGATTGKAGLLENEPRIDFTGGGCGALLLEPQRTNLALNSEYLSKYIHYPSTATISLNAAVSPEGVQNACEFTFTGSGNDYAYLDGAYTTTGASVFSVYMRVSSGTKSVSLRTWTTGIFNAVNVTTEWQRFELNIPSALSGDRIGIDNRVAYGGSGTEGIIEVYGLQCEQGSYPTSYIPTHGSTVTRQAEGKVNRTSNPIFFDSNENFTLFFDGEFSDPYFNAMIMGGRTISTSYWWIQNYQSGKLSSHLGTEMANWSGMNLQVNKRYKMLVVRNENVITFYLNGVALKTNQTAYSADPYYFNSLGYGFNDAASYAFNGKLNQALVFERALTDEECSALTQP